MSQMVSKFITTLVVHYPIRHESDAAEDQWLQSMTRNLRGYDSDVLDKAAQKLIDTRTDRRFPLPSECKKACEEIAKFKRFSEPALAGGLSKERTYEGQYKLADELILTPLGKQAARESWVLSLHDFIRANGRLPTQPWEITKCKAGAKGFDEAYEVVLRGEGGAANAALERLGASMLARREAYREKVLGK